VEFCTSACRIKKRNLFIVHQCCAQKIIEKKNNNVKGRGIQRILSLITNEAPPSQSFLLRNARCNDLESLGSGRSYVFRYFYFRRREPRLINYAV